MGRRKISSESDRCWRQVGGRVATGHVSEAKGHPYNRESGQNTWPLTEEPVLSGESESEAAGGDRDG